MRTGADLERDMGWWRFAIIYMTSGIAGFIFGGNFAPLLSREFTSRHPTIDICVFVYFWQTP
jgi:membrane associated rhomboid family serine protease